jgi:uncharacterized protein (UPF0262 family)
LIAGSDESHLRFVFTGSSADPFALARADIAPIVSEYVGVIKKMSHEDLHSAHVMALDMAKRVVHDAGARRIGELIPDLSPNFETRRRFFSLVVALIVDTTRLGKFRHHLPVHRRRGT